MQGLGLPGSSSHRNGTEAEVWSGGVSIPDGKEGSLGGIVKNNGSLGLEFGSASASESISVSVSILCVLSVCVCVGVGLWEFYMI